MWRHGTLFYIIIANFKKIKEPNRVRYRTDSTKNEMIKNYAHQMWLKRKSKIFFRHILYRTLYTNTYWLTTDCFSLWEPIGYVSSSIINHNWRNWHIQSISIRTENNSLIKGNWDINIPSLVLFAEIDSIHRIFAWFSKRVKELKGQCSHVWSQPRR